MLDPTTAAAQMVCAGFEGTTVPQSLIELFQRGVSAVVLFSRNYSSPKQLADLCHAIKSGTDRPVLICIDQEGGRVQRLPAPFTDIPSMRAVGGIEPIELATRYACDIGRIHAAELRAVGIDMNLAPVLDVDSNPANPVIGERSFGSDPARVAMLGCAVIDGLQSSGIAACGKHFPGHGDTAIDSHFDLPRVAHDEHRLQQVELPPFNAAIRTGVSAIMTSHVLLPALDSDLPATMSQAILDRLLRQQMGFEGVVISDDLEMQAITNHYGIERAVIKGAQASVDLFLICHQVDRQHAAIDALAREIRDGRLSKRQMASSTQRRDKLFQQYVRPSKAWSDEAARLIGCAEHRRLAARPPTHVRM